MASSDKLAIMDILKRTPEFKPAEVAVAEEVIDSYLRDSSGSGYNILVAELGSSVVGYVCYGPTPLTEGTWDLYWIAVSPELQTRRIGKSLLISAENAVKTACGRLILVETSSLPEYEKTRHFYHSNGYEIVCRIADFYSRGDDKLIFQKRALQ